jgi:hypothetical protein
MGVDTVTGREEGVARSVDSGLFIGVRQLPEKSHFKGEIPFFRASSSAVTKIETKSYGNLTPKQLKPEK